MQLPIQITWREMPPSPAVDTRIREKAEKLNRFYDRIIGCRIVVDSPQRHKHQGKHYSIHIDLTVPGAELAVTRFEHEDIYVAVREAFSAASRQLEDYARRQRGEVKGHAQPQHGRVARLFPAQGYGFLEANDGREVYFNRGMVLSPSFEELHIGSEVSFIEAVGTEGPQAHRVTRNHSRNHKHRTAD